MARPCGLARWVAAPGQSARVHSRADDVSAERSVLGTRVRVSMGRCPVKDRCGRRTARYDFFRNRRRPDLRTKDGVIYAKRPSAVPKWYSAISGAIPIGSPSATSASSVARTTRSASAGGTMRMGTRPRSCASWRRHSSAGFCVLPKGFQRGAKQAASLCLAFPLAPAEPLRPPSLMVLLFLKVTGIDSTMGLPRRTTVHAIQRLTRIVPTLPRVAVIAGVQA